MVNNRPFFGPVEYALLGGIIILTISGVTLVGVTGIISIPGVPILFADRPIETVAKPPVIKRLASPRPFQDSSLLDDVPSPSPSLTVSSSPSPTVDIDNQRIDGLTQIQLALTQRAKTIKTGPKYPISETFTKGNTSDTASPLAVLVPTYLATGLPVDPESPAAFYGYKSDGQTFELTAKLSNTKNPAGKFVGDTYLYVLKNQ